MGPGEERSSQSQSPTTLEHPINSLLLIMNNNAEIAGRAPDKISQSLPVPEYKMGWIIGKRGSYINQLAKKSGASISVSDSTSKEYGTVWKYVQLTGSGRAVDRAKKLLHIRLERLEPRLETEEIAGSNMLSENDDDGDFIDDGLMNNGNSGLRSDFNSIVDGGGPKAYKNSP